MSQMSRIIRWLTGEEDSVAAAKVDAQNETESEVDNRGNNEESKEEKRVVRRRSQPVDDLPPVENDADAYEVTIKPADVEPGTDYWRVQRVHHLNKDENNGRHHIYIEAWTADGRRAFHSQAQVSWDGGQQTIPIDKPTGEPGANFPMWKWQVCSVKMTGLPSDRVIGLHTGHPDEPHADGSQSGNTLFHHSFLVEFYQMSAAATAGIRGSVRNPRPDLILQLVRTDTDPAERVDSVEVGNDGSFAFENVVPGAYELRLADGSETLSRPVTVAAGEEVDVTLALSPRQSILEGIVHNGGGLTLRLVLEGEVMAEGVLGESGSFRLRNLGPGTYFLQVIDPQVAEPVATSDPLEVDGISHREVTLAVVPEPDEESDRFLPHYVLFGPPQDPATGVHLALLVRKLVERQWTFGFQADEAARAKQVTIVGDREAVPEAVVEHLREQGCTVRRLAGPPTDLLEALDNE